MGRTFLASLCILVVFLATFSRVGQAFSVQDVAQSGGLVQLLNNKNDMSFQNEGTFSNGTVIDDTTTTLPKGTPWKYEVMEGITKVQSSFKMTNTSGLYIQEIISWADPPVASLPVNCAPICYWVVDEHGFSVSDPSQGGMLHFLGIWNGPYPPQ